jgi:hypothetical protein
MYRWRPTTKRESQLDQKWEVVGWDVRMKTYHQEGVPTRPEVRSGQTVCEDEDLPPRLSPNSTRSGKWWDGMWGWRPTTKSESQLDQKWEMIGWDVRMKTYHQEWVLTRPEVRSGRMGCKDEDLPPRVSPNSTRSEKWSDGMWGCGQPMILLSFSHSSDIGPRIPEHKKLIN